MEASNATHIVCPSHAELAALLDEDAEESICYRLETHLTDCLDCRTVLEKIAHGPDTWAKLEPIIRQCQSRIGDTDPGADGQIVVGPLDFPGYEVLDKIGQGGMSEVYRARERQLNRIVALKVLAISSPDRAVRFRVEAEAAALLQHPNIVQVYRAGMHGGRLYIALEYVQGGDLAKRLGGNPLPVPEAVDLLITLAQAVQAAHDAGILHRDLKPANVLLQMADGKLQNEKPEDASVPQSAIRNPQSPIPKITDFGLACGIESSDGPTRTGEVLGTPSYMAPEQASAEKGWVTVRVDVYALGAILYECLTGRPPFRADAPLATLQQVVGEDPAPPSRWGSRVPPDLETICLKCLAKQPHKRYASAAELAADLDRYRAGKPIQARRSSLWERACKWAWRRPAAAAVLAVGCLAVVTLLAIWLKFTDDLRRERDRVVEERAQALLNYKLARGAVDKFFIEVSDDAEVIREGLDPLRKRLLVSAKDFYEQLVKLRGDDPALREDQAWAWYRLAMITAMTSSQPKAVPIAKKAIALFDSLRQDFPNRADYRRALADAHRMLSECYRLQGKLHQAETAVRQAIAHLSENSSAECYSLSLAFGQLGWIINDARRMPEARASYEMACVLQERLLRHAPQVRKFRANLASLKHRLGMVCSRMQLWRQAEAAHLHALQLRRQLAKDYPEERDYPFREATSLIGLAHLAYFRERMSESESYCRSALVILEPLCLRHPSVARHHLYRAVANSRLGAVCYRTMRPELAEEFYKSGLAAIACVAELDPTDCDYLESVAGINTKIAQLYRDTKRPQQADSAWQKALAAYEDLDRRTTTYAVRTAICRSKYAAFLANQGHYDKAQVHARKTLDFLAPYCRKHPTNVLANDCLTMVQRLCEKSPHGDNARE